jgi:hypothetical protein
MSDIQRCKTCNHWGLVKRFSIACNGFVWEGLTPLGREKCIQSNSSQTCMEIRTSGMLDIFADGSDGIIHDDSIETMPDFGCVLHEPMP